QHVSQRVLAVEDHAVQPGTLRGGTLEVRPLHHARHRPRVLRHPFAHERLHPRLRAPFLRRDRRRGSLPARRGPAGHLYAGRLEREHARGRAAPHGDDRGNGGRSRRRLHDPMRIISSLTNRIFFASALLAVLSIGAAVYMVNRAVTQQAEDELHRGINEAATLVEEYRKFSFETFARDARLIANLPTLKAAVDTHDPATVEPIAREYQSELANADLFAIVDNRGAILARLGTSDVSDTVLEKAATVGRTTAPERNMSWPEQRGILLIKSVPIWIDPQQPDVLGTLILGASLDNEQATRFKTLTNSEIAFGVNGRILASTLPQDTWPALASLLNQPGASSKILLNGQDYLAFSSPRGSRRTGQGQPIGIVLRSQSERLMFLRQLHTQLGATAVAVLLLAILISYLIARTVTRPVEAVTSTMREMAASGDLSRR